ncbi:3414_t:CDS:1, partial [Acaulospora morrowiae]
IQISLIGVESYRTGIRKCINQDDDRNNPKNERNLFYKKTKLAWLSCPAQRTSSLPKATEVSNLDVRFEFKLDDEMPTSFKTSKNFLGMRNGSIKYFIVAEVYTQSKKFVSPNHQVLKNVQVEVPIVRWSLPSEKKSSHGFETIVRKRKALYEPVQSILDQSSYDLNSTIRMTIMILFPKPGLFIKEVIGCIEEQHQIFKTDSDEVPMVIKRKVALQKINGAEVKKLSLSSPSSANVMNDDDSDTASIDDEEENYMFEVKMKIPSKEENVISPTMIDNPMVSRRVLHKIKIKVKFNNFRELKIERDVEIRNSL